MRLLRVAVYAILLSASIVGLVACGLFDKDESPTAPSTPRPPVASAPVRYTAIGASDAIGVGASVVCVPFTPCENGTGYVPLLARRVAGSREVTLTNLGIPGSVLSPTIHQIAQAHGRDIPANFVDREMPFVPSNATLITIFGGANDTNALADAIERGAAGNDVRGYIATQVRAFGADYERLVRGVRTRAPEGFIILLNVPNMAGLPYAAGFSQSRRQVLRPFPSASPRKPIDRRVRAWSCSMFCVTLRRTIAGGIPATDSIQTMPAMLTWPNDFSRW